MLAVPLPVQTSGEPISDGVSGLLFSRKAPTFKSFEEKVGTLKVSSTLLDLAHLPFLLSALQNISFVL